MHFVVFILHTYFKTVFSLLYAIILKQKNTYSNDYNVHYLIIEKQKRMYYYNQQQTFKDLDFIQNIQILKQELTKTCQVSSFLQYISVN